MDESTAGMVEVREAPYEQHTFGEIRYELRDDGWHVEKEPGAGFEQFASGDADETTVRQLIRKEYDCRY